LYHHHILILQIDCSPSNLSTENKKKGAQSQKEVLENSYCYGQTDLLYLSIPQNRSWACKKTRRAGENDAEK